MLTRSFVAVSLRVFCLLTVIVAVRVVDLRCSKGIRVVYCGQCC